MNDRADGDGPTTVLVVDDEQNTADLYSDRLAPDYEVLTAYSGDQALRMIDSSVDVVLLDRRMPGLSGEEVLEQIRDREVGCRVVLVTAVEPDTGIVDLPLDDYLVKPVTGDELQDAIERMLVRNSHDERVQEVVSLASKMATLESKMDIDELEGSDEYAELENRFTQLRDELDLVDRDDDLYAELSRMKIQTVFD